MRKAPGRDTGRGRAKLNPCGRHPDRQADAHPLTVCQVKATFRCVTHFQPLLLCSLSADDCPAAQMRTLISETRQPCVRAQPSTAPGTASAGHVFLESMSKKYLQKLSGSSTGLHSPALRCPFFPPAPTPRTSQGEHRPLPPRAAHTQDPSWPLREGRGGLPPPSTKGSVPSGQARHAGGHSEGEGARQPLSCDSYQLLGLLVGGPRKIPVSISKTQYIGGSQPS